MKTYADHDPSNVHILLDFGTNSLIESAMDKHDKDRLTVNIERIHEVWKQAGGDIPSYILSNNVTSTELQRWMVTNLKIVHPGPTVQENKTRRHFLHGDEDNDRQFFWPYASLQDMRPRYILQITNEEIYLDFDVK